jgi:AraC-like protein
VNSTKPLDNFPLVRSRDIEEVREAIARIYTKPALVPARGVKALNATVNNCRLHNIDLSYGAFGAAVEIEFPATGFFCQLFPIRGKGDVLIGHTPATLTAGAVAVIPADAGISARYSDDYEYLVLRINARKLTEKLAALTGATINEPLRIGPRQDWRHPASQMLQQYVPLLIETLSDANPPFPEWWIAQTEQLLMTLFLCGHRHNYSYLLEQDAPDAAARQVRQAEEFIVANAERAITLEELAEVTGVSAFSLFSAFKKHRGYSPTQFIAQIRPRQGKIR